MIEKRSCRSIAFGKYCSRPLRSVYTFGYACKFKMGSYLMCIKENRHIFIQYDVKIPGNSYCTCVCVKIFQFNLRNEFID